MGDRGQTLDRVWRALPALFLLVVGTLRAEPLVIHDSGQTRPLAPYRSALTPQHIQPPAHRGHCTAEAHFDINRYLPVRTPALTPGRIVRHTLTHTPPTPLFLIGADPLSQHWLAIHRDRLLALGATGLLVQAENSAELKTMARLGQGLRIAPVSGQDLAHRLGIEHYPVLISRRGIEQ